MPPLTASSVSLRSLDGGNITTFNVDPVRYSPFVNAKRGSTHKVLSGSVVHQDMGLQTMDFFITLEGEITDYATMQDLWTKFRAQGTTWELRDWFDNRFQVVFAPGQAAFQPVPIRGSCTSFEYTMTFWVTRVLQWFGNPY